MFAIRLKVIGDRFDDLLSFQLFSSKKRSCLTNNNDFSLIHKFVFIAIIFDSLN
jgi:hypothetical protein